MADDERKPQEDEHVEGVRLHVVRVLDVERCARQRSAGEEGDRACVAEPAEPDIERRWAQRAGNQRRRHQGSRAGSEEAGPQHQADGETGLGLADGDELGERTLPGAKRLPCVVVEQSVWGYVQTNDERGRAQSDRDESVRQGDPEPAWVTCWRPVPPLSTASRSGS